MPNNDPIELKPVEKDVVNFVDLTNDGPVAGTNPHADYIRFWDQFLHKYRAILKSDTSIPL